MLILKALILGVVQGLTEFLPVSSSGHLSLFANLLGVEIDLPFMILLHLGTLAAVLLYFRTEALRCVYALCGIAGDLIYNGKKLFSPKAANEEASFRKILTDSYRKIVLMLLLTMLPTVLIGAVICPLSENINENLLCSGAGMLITALLLMVAFYTDRNGKGPREAKYSDALLIGVFQGMASFPGISRLGSTLSGSLICGFSVRFSRLYCFLLVIPTVLGAMILEIGRKEWSISVGIFPSIVGMAAAIVVGYYTIRLAMKLLSAVSTRGFSIYCGCVGLISIVLYMFV